MSDDPHNVDTREEAGEGIVAVGGEGAPAAPEPVAAEPNAPDEAAGAAAEGDADLATAAGMDWYVLRVASNKEEQVRGTLERKVKIEGLDDRVGRILVPTLKEKRMKAGVLKVHERKLYPGYVFVEMAVEEDGSVMEGVWFLVKETSGVGDFIGSDGKPTSMPRADVVQMLEASRTADEEPTLSGLNIKPGEQVKITGGAFESYEGEVEAVDERRGMVSVVVSIFGRQTPIEVGYWELEKVE